jgi:hypothetical protein
MLVQRHLVLLAWLVAGLLLSQTVYFDRCKSALPLGHCLAASWQRLCRRWLKQWAHRWGGVLQAVSIVIEN